MREKDEKGQVRSGQVRLGYLHRYASRQQTVEETLARKAVSGRGEAEGALAVEQHALPGGRVQRRGVRVVSQRHGQTLLAPARVLGSLAVRVQAPAQLVGGHRLRHIYKQSYAGHSSLQLSLPPCAASPQSSPGTAEAEARRPQRSCPAPSYDSTA